MLTLNMFATFLNGISTDPNNKEFFKNEDVNQSLSIIGMMFNNSYEDSIENRLTLNDSETCDDEQPIDSVILKYIGDYFYALSNIVKDAEIKTNQPPITEYKHIFSEEFINTIINSEDYLDCINGDYYR